MKTRLWEIGLLGLMLALFACGREAAVPPPTQIIVCNPGSDSSVTRVFRPNQTDSLVLNGHKLIIEERALTAETEFTMQELPTPIIKVRLWQGKNEHPTFPTDKPAILALNYGNRCPPPKRDQLAKGSVSMYRLRSDNSADTAPLNSTPLPPISTPIPYEVRASLSQLSGYGLGAP